MAINGVNGNPLELVISTNKGIQDFIDTIKTGDTLRGKVIELIQGENKAIINFRGFNIISDLPIGANLSPGDIINVQVSNLNDKVFMKLISGTVELGQGAQLLETQPVTIQQIISMLNAIKVPVNEQNIFIAQKLMDYHLPITAENILIITASLGKYMENKGLDSRSILGQTPQTNQETANLLQTQVTTTQILITFDVESAISSLTFLMSRNLPLSNDIFTDTMAKYFKNDMKLNQNMEALNISFDRLNLVKNIASSDRLVNASINNINNEIVNIKELMRGISINPTEKNLTMQILQDQVVNFFDKSGLNTENQIKEVVLGTLNQSTVLTASKETLKAKLLNLVNQIESLDITKVNPQQKTEINNVKEKALDLLTNINAIQFINQKPIAYDALYTQIPILLNNKYFNGELQVWFRKGSLKENYEKALPINFVFVLNTSNMGNVKISMTVHKKNAECVVTTESEKAKQILMREKAGFLKSISAVDYNMKSFDIRVQKDSPVNAPTLSEGYVNLGRINLQA